MGTAGGAQEKSGGDEAEAEECGGRTLPGEGYGWIYWPGDA